MMWSDRETVRPHPPLCSFMFDDYLSYHIVIHEEDGLIQLNQLIPTSQMPAMAIGHLRIAREHRLLCKLSLWRSSSTGCLGWTYPSRSVWHLDAGQAIVVVQESKMQSSHMVLCIIILYYDNLWYILGYSMIFIDILQFYIIWFDTIWIYLIFFASWSWDFWAPCGLAIDLIALEWKRASLPVVIHANLLMQWAWSTGRKMRESVWPQGILRYFEHS